MIVQYGRKQKETKLQLTQRARPVSDNKAIYRCRIGTKKVSACSSLINTTAYQNIQFQCTRC
jgi:hypothetical protein